MTTETIQSYDDIFRYMRKQQDKNQNNGLIRIFCSKQEKVLLEKEFEIKIKENTIRNQWATKTVHSIQWTSKSLDLVNEYYGKSY